MTPSKAYSTNAIFKSFILIIFFTYLPFVYAVNVQQFSRSNSLTFEMIEDARLSSSHVINHYEWLFNLGISYVDEPLTIKNSDNSKQIDSIVSSMQSIHLGAAYYLKPWWQLAINTSLSNFENNLDKTITEFQDIDLKSKFRIYDSKKNAFTLMPVLSIPLNGGETAILDKANPPENYGTDEVLSDSGLGYGLFLIYEHLFRYFQVSFNLGYKLNSDAKFVDNLGVIHIDKSEVLTAGIGAYLPVHKKIGLNIEYLQNFTNPIFSGDVNPAELFFGASGGLKENIHGFIGIGFGNFFSDNDGNDFRVVAGLKFTPGTLSKDIKQNSNKYKSKPTKIVEDYKKDLCKKAYLFGDSNAITILFKNDSSIISNIQKNRLETIIRTVRDRDFDIQSIKIFGHTSTVGSTQYNKELGLRRAKKIQSFLTERDVSSHKIEIITSLGENELLEPESEIENKKVNRRTEIHFKLIPEYRGCYE